MLYHDLKTRFRNLTIRKKLALMIVSASAISVMLASSVFYLIIVNHFSSSYEKALSGLAEVMALNCQASVAFKLPDEADKILSSLSARPSIDHAVILDARGTVFSTYGNSVRKVGNPGMFDPADKSAKFMSISQDIKMGDATIGKLVLYDDMRSISRMRMFAFLAALLAIFFAIAAAFIMALPMQRGISAPILSLSSTARLISQQQDFSLRADKQGDDEVGQLVDDFNSMIGHIEEKNEERRRSEAERQKLEAQLLQAQKMEAIGQLAGGVAHDFNNMLQAIIGYASLLDMKIDSGSPLKPYVSEILSSSEKSTDLTKQLLAFSRRQIISPRQADLNELIRGMEKLIRRLIGEDIEFITNLSDSPLPVVVDPGQIGQVLMNLCTNARDAMPDGGHLSITTETVQLGDDYIAANIINAAGAYALMSVTDTGCGMDEETIQKIFDPFFTTKEMGKGTGLGLSMAYGIVKQHNGHISVYSEPGRGTTFRIYLPLGTATVNEKGAEKAAAPKGGKETILIAEDNDEVRKLLRDVLEGFGYTVITAADGEEALKKFLEDRDSIQLVMLDVIMPKKNGKEVYDAVKSIKPGLNVLFSSGYTADVISMKGVLEEKMDFISKPVTPHDLLGKIREILDRQA